MLEMQITKIFYQSKIFGNLSVRAAKSFVVEVTKKNDGKTDETL
jgi:hypothetical protein